MRKTAAQHIAESRSKIGAVLAEFGGSSAPAGPGGESNDDDSNSVTIPAAIKGATGEILGRKDPAKPRWAADSHNELIAGMHEWIVRVAGKRIRGSGEIEEWLADNEEFQRVFDAASDAIAEKLQIGGKDY